MITVSVVIPTFNRFKFLLHAIDSVKAQTYTNIEIIVVNDGSSEQQYYNYDWEGVNIIHLEKNTKERLGFACTAYVRNVGIENANGEYIAFCDDDDVWLPHKIQSQLDALEETGCRMSCTDGYIGSGVYENGKRYPKYNGEYHYDTLRNIYRNYGSDVLDYGFPTIWDLAFLSIHNCVVCSSVIMHRDILIRINNMTVQRNGREDYDCWLKALEHTNIAYVPDVCFYYDSLHGYGQHH